MSRDIANFIEFQFRFDAINAFERHGNFAKIGIPRALAHAVNRALNPVCTGADRCYGAGRGEAEIIMPVKMQRNGRP